MELTRRIDEISERCQKTFEARRRIVSFQQYLEILEAAPQRHLRTAPQYTLDMMHHYGYEEAERIGLRDRRWKVFDAAFDPSLDSLVGQERVQNEIYRQIQQFARRGRSDKMLLLHGPNGSSKSTIISLLMSGLEHYSVEPEGALYRFNWIFAERDERALRIGFEATEEDGALPKDTYAHLDAKEISARIQCELKDPPIFLVPRAEREELVRSIIESHPDPENFADLNFDYFLNGELCPKCRKIYDSLYTSCKGNWEEVIRHVQVERYFVSKRYRQSAISIEPQGNVDAATRPVSYEPSIQLPAILQGQQLVEPVGDLVESNHGIVEYSDFLKRPLETNKYLLTTSEKGTINLQGFTGFLDAIICGTANEKHLSMFKRSTDFPSFKGRIELTGVPYLLRYTTEAELYQRSIAYYSRGRHVTPHTSEMAALWAVLTRLRRPSAKNFSPDLAPLVARLSPLEKAKLYAHSEAPLQLRSSDRTQLESSIRAIREELDESEGEFEGIPGAEYEGRRGASPREMLSLLADAAENKAYECLTPMAVFDELENLVKDASLYEFLRFPVDNGYNDCYRFIEDVKQHYLELVVQEVYASIGLVEEQEYERVFQEYFHHVKSFDLGEKIFISARGEYVEPSEDLMQRVESLVQLHEPIDRYRSNLITKIAAYSLDHPDEPIRYEVLFPDIYNNLKQSFYRERDRTLTAIEHNVLRFATDEFNYLTEEEKEQVRNTLERMQSQFGYCLSCAKDVIAFVLRSR